MVHRAVCWVEAAKMPLLLYPRIPVQEAHHKEILQFFLKSHMHGDVHCSDVHARHNWKPCECLTKGVSKVNMMCQLEIRTRKSTKWKHRKRNQWYGNAGIMSPQPPFLCNLLPKCHYGNNDKNVGVAYCYHDTR